MELAEVMEDRFLSRMGRLVAEAEKRAATAEARLLLTSQELEAEREKVSVLEQERAERDRVVQEQERVERPAE